MNKRESHILAALRDKCCPGITAFTESIVEQAALAWLASAGWSVKNGAEIAGGERAAERDYYGYVVLAPLPRDALARLNPSVTRRGTGGCLPQN
ncbi:MAG: hypothetical protein ACREWG_13590 [Gammaproteobacteria bacterium]